MNIKDIFNFRQISPYGFVWAACFLLMCIPVFSVTAESQRDFEIRSGNMKVVLHKETGTFALYKLSEIGKDKYEPILDTRNYGAGTKFAVSAGKKVFPLERKLFRSIGFEISDGGSSGVFIFTPSDEFQVRQKFYFSKNTSSENEEVFLIIENSVENTSGKANDFSCRALFDTMLGETGSVSNPEHFITDTGRKITAETILTPGESDRVLFSSNGKRSCAFVLAGMDVGKPESVYIANWNRCEALLTNTEKASSVCVEGRAFSTVYAPNDSALLFTWPEVKLAHREVFSVKVALSAMDYGSPLDFIPASDDDSSDTENIGLHEEVDFYSGLSFEEKRSLYLRVSERLNQIEAGDSSVTPSEIAELNRILDIILEEE